MGNDNIYQELNAKIMELENFCMNNKIPFFATYAQKRNKDIEYKTTMLTPLNLRVEQEYEGCDKISTCALAMGDHIKITVDTTNPLSSLGDAMDDFLD